MTALLIPASRVGWPVLEGPAAKPPLTELARLMAGAPVVEGAAPAIDLSGLVLGGGAAWPSAAVATAGGGAAAASGATGGGGGSSPFSSLLLRAAMTAGENATWANTASNLEWGGLKGLFLGMPAEGPGSTGTATTGLVGSGGTLFGWDWERLLTDTQNPLNLSPAQLEAINTGGPWPMDVTVPSLWGTGANALLSALGVALPLATDAPDETAIPSGINLAAQLPALYAAYMGAGTLAPAVTAGATAAELGALGATGAEIGAGLAGAEAAGLAGTIGGTAALPVAAAVLAITTHFRKQAERAMNQARESAGIQRDMGVAWPQRQAGAQVLDLLQEPNLTPDRLRQLAQQAWVGYVQGPAISRFLSTGGGRNSTGGQGLPTDPYESQSAGLAQRTTLGYLQALDRLHQATGSTGFGAYPGGAPVPDLHTLARAFGADAGYQGEAPAPEWRPYTYRSRAEAEAAGGDPTLPYEYAPAVDPTGLLAQFAPYYTPGNYAATATALLRAMGGERFGASEFGRLALSSLGVTPADIAVDWARAQATGAAEVTARDARLAAERQQLETLAMLGVGY